MVTTYSFEDYVLNFGGHQVEGWSDGDSLISVERDVDAFSILGGGKGDAIFLHNAIKTGSITFELMQGSTSLPFLSAYLNTSERVVRVPVPVFVMDIATQLQVAFSPFAMLARPANQVNGQGHNPRVWQAVCSDLVMLDGGEVGSTK